MGGVNDPLPPVAGVERRPAGGAETARANRAWWDAAADGYQREHGGFLGDASFIWCPEGLDEADVHLLGDVAGLRVLEVGCGAAQCSRWLRAVGALPVGLDIAAGQLRHARRLDERHGCRLPLVQADATALPFADESFDAACSAFGAMPFVADSGAVMAEVARVLRPGGRWVFSVTHPVRWCFPDDPGPVGLTVSTSYFDRRPYVEVDGRGRATYVEHHRTLGDRVREVVAAGLAVLDVVEPEWPAGHTREWGQWSPLRGRLFPGTAVFVTVKPAAASPT
jgi:SAM-dependent methyltransferase